MVVTIDPSTVEVEGTGVKDHYRMTCKANEIGVIYAVKLNITNATTTDQILTMAQNEVNLQKMARTPEMVKQKIVEQLKAMTVKR